MPILPLVSIPMVLRWIMNEGLWKRKPNVERSKRKNPSTVQGPQLASRFGIKVIRWSNPKEKVIVINQLPMEAQNSLESVYENRFQCSIACCIGVHYHPSFHCRSKRKIELHINLILSIKSIKSNFKAYFSLTLLQMAWNVLQFAVHNFTAWQLM